MPVPLALCAVCSFSVLRYGLRPNVLEGNLIKHIYVVDATQRHKTKIIKVLKLGFDARTHVNKGLGEKEESTLRLLSCQLTLCLSGACF